MIRMDWYIIRVNIIFFISIILTSRFIGDMQ